MARQRKSQKSINEKIESIHDDVKRILDKVRKLEEETEEFFPGISADLAYSAGWLVDILDVIETRCNR